MATGSTNSKLYFMDRRLVVEPLLSESEALEAVSEADRVAAASFSRERRRDYLSWRAMVYREIGPVTILYDRCGAPFISDGSGIRIGVSHGAGRVCLCLSDKPCAVDIEGYDRDFDRLAPRYLAPEELELDDGDPRFRAVAWSAKEVLYKLSGRRGLSLIRDLHLTAVGNGWIEGRIENGEPLQLSVRDLGDAVVVWYL